MLELVGPPAAGKSTAVRAAAVDGRVERPMLRLDHDLPRARRLLERLAVMCSVIVRHPVWFARATLAVLQSGQPSIAAAVRLLPNLLVVTGLVERARRRGRRCVLDQGPWQFEASVRATATNPFEPATFVPMWARPDTVVLLDPGEEEVQRRLAARQSGRSRGDGPEAGRFAAAFRSSLRAVPVDHTETTHEKAVAAIEAAVGGDHPRHVCHLITWLDRGGAQANTLLSVRGQIENGQRVSVVHGSNGSDVGVLAEDFEGAGAARVRVRALRREVNVLCDLAVVPALVITLRRLRPDVVHTHSSKAGLAGRLAARIAGVPAIVHTVHGWSFHDHQRPIVRRALVLLERMGVSLCDAVVVLAESDRRKASLAGIETSADFVLIRSGIDLDPFREVAGWSPARRADVRKSLGLGPGPVVGSVTRLSDQKDPLTLVEVLGRVIEHHPDSHGLILGDGPLRSVVEQRLNSLGITSAVHLLGSRDDVPDVLAAIDVFVLTSLWEGLPRVVPEAMAAGVPVVATDVDGTSEIVENDVTGILVRPGQVDEIADAVSGLLRDTARARRLAEAASLRAEAWSAPRMVDALDSLYDALLSTPSRAAR